MSKKSMGTLMLLTTAFIWGTAFVAQKDGMNYIRPFTFNGLRCYIAFFPLLLVLIIFNSKTKNLVPGINKKNTSEQSTVPDNEDKKSLWAGGIVCGIFLFAASTLQQYGLIYTTAGKGGFITALYIVLVPLYGLLRGKKVRPLLWLCVFLAVIGLYLLTIKENFSINKGDILVMMCAFLFAAHILAIDYFSPKTNSMKMSCIQFFFVAVLSTPCMIIFDNIDWHNVFVCLLPLLYSGVFSGGIAYTLQIAAQKHAEPTVASLLLSLESVFAVIAGILILNEGISIREFIGCVIIFVAITMAQLPENFRLKRR